MNVPFFFALDALIQRPLALFMGGHLFDKKGSIGHRDTKKTDKNNIE